MEKNSGVIMVYKKLGETPYQAILRWKYENPEYKDTIMTYAGRLDPMAEGLLLVLSGDEILNKEKYLDLQKTYEFEILWGFETDTLDVLGKVESYKVCKVHKVEDIEKELKKLIGKFVQKYPAYSSKPVLGKSLFQWAREGKIGEIEIPSHEVEIYKAKFISEKSVSSSELLKEIISKISLVSGDFRQNEIIENWREVMSKGTFDMFIIHRISMTVSSGFYVRQFVSDLAESLGTSAVTFHIKRTRVGEYDVKETL